MENTKTQLSKDELTQIYATAREARLPVVWSEKRALKHFKSKITPEVVEEMARALLAGMSQEAQTVSIPWPEHRLKSTFPGAVPGALHGWNECLNICKIRTKQALKERGIELKDAE